MRYAGDSDIERNERKIGHPQSETHAHIYALGGGQGWPRPLMITRGHFRIPLHHQHAEMDELSIF